MIEADHSKLQKSLQEASLAIGGFFKRGAGVRQFGGRLDKMNSGSESLPPRSLNIVWGANVRLRQTNDRIGVKSDGGAVCLGAERIVKNDEEFQAVREAAVVEKSGQELKIGTAHPFRENDPADGFIGIFGYRSWERQE